MECTYSRRPNKEPRIGQARLLNHNICADKYIIRSNNDVLTRDGVERRAWLPIESPLNGSSQSTIRSEEYQAPNAALDVGRPQQDTANMSTSRAGDRNGATASTTASITASRNTRDIIDTNRYTKNLEFYGSASSVAFLRHVETLSECHPASALPPPSGHSLASLLHNTDFEPNTVQRGLVPDGDTKICSDRFYFRVAGRFLDAYFRNIHYIQPIFEEDAFLTRCEDLWFNKATQQPLSFIALYYATLSLGSLVMTLEDSTISGKDRFTWSRKLCNDAQSILKGLWSATDLEMVQCFYMMVSSNAND